MTITTTNAKAKLATTTLKTTATSKSKDSPKKDQSFLDLIRTGKGVSNKSSSKPSSIIPLKRSFSARSPLDKANETWLSEPIKLRKNNYQKLEYDRLTPTIEDMPAAQYMMNRSSDSNTTTYFSSKSEAGSESYQAQVAEACGLEPTKRILSFKSSMPSSPHVDLRKKTPKVELTTRTTAITNRHILSSPEKVLDAPCIDDDYYLNLLDWSARNIVAVGLGKSVYLWSADTGSIEPLNYNGDDQVTSVSWSNDGAYLSVGTSAGDTQVWDVESNQKLRSMTGQNCRIGVLSWNKHLVSSGGRNGSIFHHDVRMAKHTVKELYGHQDDVCGLTWRWDGELLASGGNDDTVNIWDSRGATPKFTKTNHSGAIKALAWCPWKHNTLATGGGREDKNIHFWDSTTGALTHSIKTGAQVTSLNWSKHYREITSTHGAPHNHISVWAYPSLHKVIDIKAHESRILHSALSPDGQVLATAAADDNLKFWRIFDAQGKSMLDSRRNGSVHKTHDRLKRNNSIR
ncbi:WD40-repeat-containing domain protein [Pilaira anomala]|nr:WD40-repeat-containing domain protein [Pilaira anomala]